MITVPWYLPPLAAFVAVALAVVWGVGVAEWRAR
jgi:hypothetical protein